jgi:hypothetical protein
MKLATVLVVLALVSSIGLVAVDQALTESASEFAVQDEQFTPQTGTYVQVNVTGSNLRYSSEAEILVEKSNGKQVPPSAYRWNATDGTIYTVPGGDLDGESNATITYDVFEPTPVQRNLGESFGSVMGASSVVLFVIVAGLAFRSMRAFL